MVANKVIPPAKNPDPKNEPATASSAVPGTKDAEGVMVSKDHLLKVPTPGKDGRRKSSSTPKSMPAAMKKMLDEALDSQIRSNVLPSKPVEVTVTKKGKSARPAKTKEELNKEMAELLWKINLLGRIQDRWADIEFKAFHSRIVISSFCVQLSLLLIPILLAILTWDFVASNFLHIPHLTTLRHPGVTLPFHFIGMPAAMYGWMLLVLHQDKDDLLKWSILCIIIHPFLFMSRCLLEVTMNGTRAERLVRYEKYVSGGDDYPDVYGSKWGTLEKEYTLGLGWPDV